MRIAIIDPSEFSPPYDAALARGLGALGHRVTLVGAAGGELGRVAGLDHVGHFYRPLATPWGRRLPAGLVRAAKGALHATDLARLPGLLRRLEVDAIHLQWAPLPLLDLAWLESLRRVAPVVLTVHDTLPYNGAEPWLMAAGMRRLTRRADAVICHTDQGRRRLLRQGVAPDRLAVVPHGLLGARVDVPPPAAGRIRLLQLGKLKPYKGVDVLLEALARLDPAERAGLEVVIAGKPYLDAADLLARARGLGLEGTVRFRLGFLPETEMNSLLAGCDAMLFPYRDIEASGVLMQAVAHGHPVVASRIGVFAELLEHGRQALLVPPGDAGQLAQALRRLVANPAGLGAMRDEMRALRDRIPDWPAIAGRTVEVYAQAAGRRQAEPRRAALEETRT